MTEMTRQMNGDPAAVYQVLLSKFGGFKGVLPSGGAVSSIRTLAAVPTGVCCESLG